MNPYNVIVKPLLSEKSDSNRERYNQYTFVVRTGSTKHEVKSAVESLFEVKVEKITTSVTRGKSKRRGAHISRLSNYKKASVTLSAGQKLDIFDN